MRGPRMMCFPNIRRLCLRRHSVRSVHSSSTVTGTFFGYRKGRAKVVRLVLALQCARVVHVLQRQEGWFRHQASDDAQRRQRVLRLMQSVSVGAGVLPVAPKSEDGDVMYLRASFQRVIGLANSESFHMINPDGSSGQELSIFLRS
ncbi:unnamed protein product [Ilex paraguariensis]|uniref:Uncharacterized protein n=1 Tax=Ilex paraguariensis TaxID=185542 RepID=A0ABC8UQV5_9AQUA